MEESEMSPEKTPKPQQKDAAKKNFICGVIEGFYGRPWTTEQRKDLFRKLKKWGMDSYVYAPKDDYKHRAFWRELYTVEEADHLSSLIAAAKEHDVMFYYALSPGLDMTYSNQKEIQTLKRKLDQVSQFGCEAFALLFDDIDAELCKTDKEVFQTFANAQVSVTNEIFTHLGSPKFLFCPTQYCTSRAVPTVHDSEYLNTLGSKLNHDIDIMWTGNKVISKTISLESIQEITEILRRPPVIWDNLHANDYDQKRVFLGPYCGRSPELIPHLRGVMTNPNCEFHANTIAIHTLAHWSQCMGMDSKLNSSLSADIKLETENDDGISTEELPDDCCLSQNIYHPRIALKNAIAEWLPEFFIAKEAWGPITKPQPQVTMVMPIIPILPSINTCMSLTTTTTTSTMAKTVTVPEVNTTQLQALADVCSTVTSSIVNPISNPVMNSLVSPTKVVTNDDILNPIPTTVASNIELPKKIPISIVPIPVMQSNPVPNSCEHDLVPCNNVISKADENTSTDSSSETKNTEKNDAQTPNTLNDKECNANNIEDIAIDEKSQHAETNIVPLDNNTNMFEEHALSPLSTGNEPMECSSSLTSQTSPRDEHKQLPEDIVMTETNSTNELNNSMQVESSQSSPLSNADMKEDDLKNPLDESKITSEDLYLLCDMFYLPFEHGSRGSKLLVDFNWLKSNANVLLGSETKKSSAMSPKPEVAEWMQRAESFESQCNSVQELLRKIANCANKEICHDLFTYVWDVAGALTLLHAFVKWLSLARFPKTVHTFTQGSYTWFSKGWKEAFESGDQEPWVFRGGLTADLQRLMPVDSANDLFLYKMPELPTSDYHVMRPYTQLDEMDVNDICTRVFTEGTPNVSISMELPENVRNLIADREIGPFLTLSPEFCIVAHDSSNNIVGYSAATKDVNTFLRNVEVCWGPAMQEKYSRSLLDDTTELTKSKELNEMLREMIREFYDPVYKCPVEVSATYPAVLTTALLSSIRSHDQSLIKRMLTVTLAALRANGCFGVHVRLPAKNRDLAQYYMRIGFTEIYQDSLNDRAYFGRRF